MSQPTGSTVVEVAASHSVVVSQPAAVADLIKQAVSAAVADLIKQAVSAVTRSRKCGPISTTQITCSIRSRRQK
jgi:hypothetical protein